MGLYKGGGAFFRVFFRLFYRVEIQGRENALETGGLVCANHISAWDPLFISSFYPHPISWMAKKELFKNKFLAKILDHLGSFPVERDKNDLGALKKAIRLLKKGNNVGIFPEGTRVKERDDKMVKPGVGLLALKTESFVSPVSIQGNYRLFSKLKLVIHPPLDAHKLLEGKTKGQESYQMVAQGIMDKIYQNME